MYGQYQTTPIQARNGDSAQVRITQNRELLVAPGGSAPVGGGITWGAATAVAMTGSSKNLVAANAGRKGIIIWSPVGNAAASYDLSGTAVTLAGGIPLYPGVAPVVITAPECPVGAITAIGTNGQNLYYSEGT